MHLFFTLSPPSIIIIISSMAITAAVIAQRRTPTYDDDDQRAPSTPPRREQHKLPLDSDAEDSPLPAPPSISRHRYGTTTFNETSLIAAAVDAPLRRHPLAAVHSRRSSADVSMRASTASNSPAASQSPGYRGPGLGAIMGMSEDSLDRRAAAAASGSARSSFSARLSGSARREGDSPAISSNSSRSRTSATSSAASSREAAVVESSSSPAAAAPPAHDSQTPAMGRSMRAGTVGTLRSNAAPRSVKPLRTHGQSSSYLLA